MRALVVSCLLIVLVSCSGGGGGGGSTQPPVAVTLEKVSLTPYVDTMALGTSLALSATGIYTDQTTKNVSDTITWSIEDETVLQYDASGGYGKIDAVGVGTSRVIVSAGNITASLELTVSPATLDALSVSPPHVALPVGGESPLEVTGLFSDDSSQDITQNITWTLGDPLIASVLNGYLTAMAQGDTTLTASYGGMQYTVTVTVSDAVLTAIELSPASISLASGLSADVHVTGIYSDNSKRDLTPLISWDSSDDTMASVTVDGDRAVLTGFEPGQVTLTAWMGDVSASSPVTITEAALSRLEISGGDDDIPNGLTRQLKATGIYTDNSSKDVTAMALWQSSDETVAVISNASESKGLLNALNQGMTRVIAHVGAITSNQDVRVGAAVLQKLQVSAGFRSLPVGLSKHVQAQGLYSDQSLRDVTMDVSWASSDTGVAVVGNGESKGRVTGAVPGTTSISAHKEGLSSSLSITITDAILMTLEISPDSASVASGQTQQFTAIGLYSDQSTSDVTKEVLWGSQGRDVALPDNSDALSGLYQALAEGSSEITAVLDEVSATAMIQVTAAELTQIFLSETGISLEKGMNQTLSVTGLYTDSTTKDISALALWESDDPDVARVENNPDGKGTVYALAQGSTTLYATVNDLNASCAITVKAAGIDHIEIGPAPDTLAAGTSAQFSVTGYFNDGSEKDLTDSVLWESSDASVADASNADGEHGLLRAYALGTATISASYLGQSDTVSVTVSEATLDSIEVLPAHDTLPSGLSLQYQAIGHFSDASVQDLTHRALWQVDDTALAIISNLGGLNGRLYTFDAGTVTVSASFGGVTGQTSLEITGATLVGLRLTPVPAAVEEGETASIVLEGIFSDESVRDLSAEAVWMSTNILVATVSNASGTEGMITGRSLGQAYILAIYSNRGFVVPVAVINGLAMAIEQVDGGLQCSAYGSVGPDQYVNISNVVTWSSSNEAVLTVSNDEGEEGFAQILAAGSSTVTATLSDTLSVSRVVSISSGG